VITVSSSFSVLDRNLEIPENIEGEPDTLNLQLKRRYPNGTLL
jgi:hypothetical protein